MVEISAALTTTMIGMMGVVLGAILSNYVNSKVALNNSRKDILFKKKLEYFENIIQAIEKNTKLYRYSLREIERKSNKKKAASIIKKLKHERKSFDAKTSPLYVDTRLFSDKIRYFVSIEKIIFSSFEELTKRDDEWLQPIENLRKNIKILIHSGNELIFQMRKNLTEK